MRVQKNQKPKPRKGARNWKVELGFFSSCLQTLLKPRPWADRKTRPLPFPKISQDSPGQLYKKYVNR